jgi:hypothetical protein
MGGGRHGFGERNWIYSGIDRLGLAVTLGSIHSCAKMPPE